MEKDSKHVLDARLFRVAVTDSLNFTEEEFNHLKQCSVCFDKWRRHIHDHLRDQNKEPKT